MIAFAFSMLWILLLANLACIAISAVRDRRDAQKKKQAASARVDEYVTLLVSAKVPLPDLGDGLQKQMDGSIVNRAYLRSVRRKQNAASAATG